MKCKLSVLIINDKILNNVISDKYSSNLISTLNKIGCDVTTVTIVKQNIGKIVKEIKLSNNESDATIIVTNLSETATQNALSILFETELKESEYLENVLKKQKISFNKQEVVILPYLNILCGKTYPLLHVQRIFLIHEIYIKDILPMLMEYLIFLRKPKVYKKVAEIQVNGKKGEIQKIGKQLKEVIVTPLTSQSVQLVYESESIDNLLDFEENLSKISSITFMKPLFDLPIYSDENTHIKHSVKVIEKCFKDYGPDNTFISFNGGKDCMVLLHMVLAVLEDQYEDRVKRPICLFVQSKEPFPEQQDFVKICQKLYNLEIVELQMDIKSALKIILQDHPNFKACLMGTRRTDPFAQHLSDFQMTDKDYPEVMRVSPILDWNYFNIWDYLLYYKVPYCQLYDMGYTSLGNVDNTMKNANLLYIDDMDGSEQYLPAYKLLKEDSERSGRNK